MARRKISTTVYITPEQDERLKLLSAQTKVPVAEYIRQGIDMILLSLSGHRVQAPGHHPRAAHEAPVPSSPATSQ